MAKDMGDGGGGSGASSGPGNDQGMAPAQSGSTRLSQATVTEGGVYPFANPPNRTGNSRGDQGMPFTVSGGNK